jgi:hypothetical protein
MVWHVIKFTIRSVNKGSYTMLYTLIVALFVLWLLGLVGHIGGALIHLLLVAAVVVFIWNLLVGHRRGV